MQLTVKEVTDILEKVAPPALQEHYDNSGLLTGSPADMVKGILIALDVTDDVLDEAIAQGANLVISHHPILFTGIKRLNGNNYVERLLIKAVRNHIALYAVHTNLDNVLQNGVNRKIAERLGLQNTRILMPLKGRLQKLVCFCPEPQMEEVRTAMFSAGAGHIGKYSDCSFSSAGTGTFNPGEGSKPFTGKIDELSSEKETRLEVIVPSHLSSQVILAMINAHPYEEVAYDLYNLENQWQDAGAGMVGELPEPLPADKFLKLVKEKMNTSCIRHTRPGKGNIQTVALCGGSGSFLLEAAKSAHADAFVTADFKYHQFFDADNEILICDIGHYESEQFTEELIRDILNEGFLSKKIANFALVLTKTVTNPVQYFN